eukprot:379741-Hanusia_phi.AAC.2
MSSYKICQFVTPKFRKKKNEEHKENLDWSKRNKRLKYLKNAWLTANTNMYFLQKDSIDLAKIMGQ